MTFKIDATSTSLNIVTYLELKQTYPLLQRNQWVIDKVEGDGVTPHSYFVVYMNKGSHQESYHQYLIGFSPEPHSIFNINNRFNFPLLFDNPKIKESVVTTIMQ